MSNSGIYSIEGMGLPITPTNPGGASFPRAYFAVSIIQFPPSLVSQTNQDVPKYPGFARLELLANQDYVIDSFTIEWKSQLLNRYYEYPFLPSNEVGENPVKNVQLQLNSQPSIIELIFIRFEEIT